MGSLSLLQGIFPAQGSNPGLAHYRQTLYQLSYQGIPENLKESTKKLLELTTELINAARFKIKIKNQLYSYVLAMNNPKIKLIKIIAFRIAL